jgi:hypothetical protein
MVTRIGELAVLVVLKSSCVSGRCSSLGIIIYRNPDDGESHGTQRFRLEFVFVSLDFARSRKLR